MALSPIAVRFAVDECIVRAFTCASSITVMLALVLVCRVVSISVAATTRSHR
jgi:hypothetical protein